MTQEEWMKKLEEEGFSDLKVISIPANNNPGEHTHEEEGVHIILQGDVTITNKGETRVYAAGDRLDVPEHTTHTAVFGSQGCTMIVGIKK